jgi:FlaA1/EpsC-like NDP-sugar epimerase
MLGTNKNMPSWVIFVIDILIVAFSITLAVLLRFNFNIPEKEVELIVPVLPYYFLVRILLFLIGKPYRGIVRYTSTKDIQRIFSVIFGGSLLFVMFNIIRYYWIDDKFFLPFSIIIIDFLVNIFMMIFLRISFKVLYMEIKNPSKEKSKVIIYGAGESGIITQRTLARDAGTNLKVVAFIDDNSSKVGKTLEGIKIYDSTKLEELLKGNDIEKVIISIMNLDGKVRRDIINTCLEHNVDAFSVPPVQSWINGELSFKQIKKVNIEDLLGRKQIKLDTQAINTQLQGKIILVTGAAGSIGSELVRQIRRFSPKKIIMLDQAETPMYNLENEIRSFEDNIAYEYVLGDIRSQDRMKRLFSYCTPDVVFHAAAYKHVPLMECNPSESVNTNIKGTKVLADLCVEYQVPTFVMISTDKAVRPTSVMGATKRAAEIYTQSLNEKGITKFITTRFGNVLGSNGSVIPVFKKQIEQGGPLTVTDPEITRFFMTIPEACQLVLEAGAMGKGGEIFIFDMGESVKIIDLAKR